MLIRLRPQKARKSPKQRLRKQNRRDTLQIRTEGKGTSTTSGKKRGDFTMKTGIVVCFPGTGFTCKEALFERCIERYATRGYDLVKLDFSHIPFREIETMEEAVTIARRAVKRQLSGIDFADYADVVWISKSLGTILAALFEEEYDCVPRQLYLTPLPETLRLIRPESRVIALVLGTQDRFLTGEALAEFCEQRNTCYCIIDGVNHSLKDEQSAERTEQINEQIAAFCD